MKSAEQSSVKMETFAVIQPAVAAAMMLTMETSAIVSRIAIMYLEKEHFY